MVDRLAYRIHNTVPLRVNPHWELPYYLSQAEVRGFQAMEEKIAVPFSFPGRNATPPPKDKEPQVLPTTPGKTAIVAAEVVGAPLETHRNSNQNENNDLHSKKEAQELQDEKESPAQESDLSLIHI